MDKLYGALYGFAIGDAMGATTEFMDAIQVQKKYGRLDKIVGGGWLKLKAGQVTDDTQMSICIMDAIMLNSQHRRVFEENCIDNFIKWFESNPPDVGGQCIKGIRALMAGKRLNPDNGLGNGSLMRALPCALVNKKDWNVNQSLLTHPNKSVRHFVEAYHDIIVELVFLSSGYKRYEGVEKYQPTGCVENTFYNALHWAGKESFYECIVGAVNDGGDADTIAAVTGSIAGARFGYDAIPVDWITSLDIEVKEKLDQFAEYCRKYWKKDFEKFQGGFSV